MGSIQTKYEKCEKCNQTYPFEHFVRRYGMINKYCHQCTYQKQDSIQSNEKTKIVNKQNKNFENTNIKYSSYQLN